MTAREPDVRAAEDPEGRLEQALIDQFLSARGLDAAAIRALPVAEAKRVLTEASTYAASKLAEVEARARFVHQIHGDESIGR